MAVTKRKFGGKYYRFCDSYKSSEEAQQQAAELRAKGKRVRITCPKSKLLPYFELWVN